MRPVVGVVSPARQLKNVDLPAPFGPIRPMISPRSTARSAPRTARKLPNALETLRASSNVFACGTFVCGKFASGKFASSMRAPPAFRHDAVPQLEQAARLEACDQNDD